ncbi:MAG: hypothetical protein EZS28_002779 [Streblomastix strix]|uniref:Uncharacterized protein n=1 Tax=Streblomastix strix TaxID=222440 RepID=A0A5J4X389_9EUKA|nr:MAG: hypothetical protein EZS28_002779 [Streblomastix strix]
MITHKQHSFSVLTQQGQRINHDRASSRQSPQVSRTIQLDNRSQPYSQPFEHYTRQLVKVIQMRRLRNQERSPLEDTQGAWDLVLYAYIGDTCKNDSARCIAIYSRTDLLPCEMNSIQNGPRKFRYFTHQSLNY